MGGRNEDLTHRAPSTRRIISSGIPKCREHVLAWAQQNILLFLKWYNHFFVSSQNLLLRNVYVCAFWQMEEKDWSPQAQQKQLPCGSELNLQCVNSSSRESLRVCSGSWTARRALCTASPLWDVGLALPRKIEIFARMQIDWPALALQNLYSHVIFLVTVQEQSIHRTVCVLLLLPRQTTDRPEELFWHEKLSLMIFFIKSSWPFFL